MAHLGLAHLGTVRRCSESQAAAALAATLARFFFLIYNAKRFQPSACRQSPETISLEFEFVHSKNTFAVLQTSMEVVRLLGGFSP